MQLDNAGKDVRVDVAASAKGGRRQLVIIITFLSLVVVAFLGLAARCIYLQYTLADRFAEKSLIQQRAYLPLEPQRGAILDCRGRVLAASDQIRTIFAEPRTIKDPKETSTRLAPILDLGAHEICKRIVDSNNPGYAVLKTHATEAECRAAQKVPGVGVRYDWRRNYPMGRLASHVVGFTSADNRGIEGIEYAFDRDLRGKGPSHRSMLVNVSRFTAVQDQVATLLHTWLSQVQQDIRNYSQLRPRRGAPECEPRGPPCDLADGVRRPRVRLAEGTDRPRERRAPYRHPSRQLPHGRSQSGLRQASRVRTACDCRWWEQPLARIDVGGTQHELLLPQLADVRHPVADRPLVRVPGRVRRPVPRRSARMTHFYSLRLTHTKNTICPRARISQAP